jgi:hypothetical protein
MDFDVNKKRFDLPVGRFCDRRPDERTQWITPFPPFGLQRRMVVFNSDLVG